MWHLCELVSPFFTWFGFKNFGATVWDRNHKTGANNCAARCKEVIWRPLPLPQECGLMFACFFCSGLHNKLILLVRLRRWVHNNNKSQPTRKMAMFLPKSIFIQSCMPPSDWMDGWHRNLWTSHRYSVQKCIVSCSLNESHKNFTNSGVKVSRNHCVFWYPTQFHTALLLLAWFDSTNTSVSDFFVPW